MDKFLNLTNHDPMLIILLLWALCTILFGFGCMSIGYIKGYRDRKADRLWREGHSRRRNPAIDSTSTLIRR